MLKVAIGVLAVVLAGSATAAGWRSLRIDASSEQSYSQSVATFQDKLSPSRRIAFARSLQDIWLNGTLAEEQQHEYTRAEYLRQLHGLRYDEVMALADPTGKAEGRYRAEYYASRASTGPGRVSRPYPCDCGYPSFGYTYENWRGRPPSGD